MLRDKTKLRLDILDEELAVKLGLNCAIVYDYMRAYMDEFGVSSYNHYDGRIWMDATMKEWHELIPYLSEAQIRTALKKLEEKKLILVRNYNTDKHHKTKWYTATDY